LLISCVDPDNYTDQATFLEKLQRNPKLKPYDFWPLVADSTVIVQHVCSVIIFVVCFVGIFQERVSPVSVVGLSSLGTFIGWVLWDKWGSQENTEDALTLARRRSLAGQHYRPRQTRKGRSLDETTSTTDLPTNGSGSLSNLPSSAASSSSNLLHTTHDIYQRHSNSRSESSNNLIRYAQSASMSSLISIQTNVTSASAHTDIENGGSSGFSNENGDGSRQNVDGTAVAEPERRPSAPLRGERNELRWSTLKSAVLIYFTLLGLSPILKSLTRSTSSDSIWAMSFWLLTINVFFFDYSGSSSTASQTSSSNTTGTVTTSSTSRIPVASLSTNAALMASTVLASRLPSTGQVFSLTLFSIEVFGLFPVFRRYARHQSLRYHVALTVLLVLGAGMGTGMVIANPRPGQAWWAPWRSGLAGMIVGCFISALAMGGCSWWLIGLQKYKNEIYGPWDPARPIIMSRRYFDGD